MLARLLLGPLLACLLGGGHARRQHMLKTVPRPLTLHALAPRSVSALADVQRGAHRAAANLGTRMTTANRFNNGLGMGAGHRAFNGAGLNAAYRQNFGTGMRSSNGANLGTGMRSSNGQNFGLQNNLADAQRLQGLRAQAQFGAANNAPFMRGSQAAFNRPGGSMSNQQQLQRNWGARLGQGWSPQQGWGPQQGWDPQQGRWPQGQAPPFVPEAQPATAGPAHAASADTHHQ